MVRVRRATRDRFGVCFSDQDYDDAMDKQILVSLDEKNSSGLQNRPRHGNSLELSQPTVCFIETLTLSFGVELQGESG